MAAAPSPARITPSHYELLQITPQASGQDLRRAFRNLSKLYHPDTTELPEQEASEAFRQLQQAYLTLSDPDRRRAYDASLLAMQAQPAVPLPSPRVVASPVPVRRALSGGEWLALLLLALAVIFSLVLGVGLAWARGAAFLRAPSWWPTAGQTAEFSPSTAPDVGSATGSGAPLQPSAAGSGALVERDGGGATRPELLPVGSPAPRLDG